MNLIQAQHIIYRLISQHLPGQGWRVDWNNSSAAAGRCKHASKTLVFSAPITREVEEDEFTDTVLHEIAHAMVGPGHSHDDVWKRQHIAIGGTGSRTWSDVDVTAKLAKWKIECYTCDFLTYRSRITRSVRVGGYCPRCKVKTQRLKITQNR